MTQNNDNIQTNTGDDHEPGQEQTEKTEKRSSFSSKLSTGFSKLKEQGKKLQQKTKDRISMEGLLKQARDSLQQFLNPDLEMEKQIPIKLLIKAKGLVFLSVVKAGFGLGGEGGTGCIILRDSKDNTKWGQPIAIGAGGIKWGLQIGVSKVDYIMVLTTDDAVKTFTTDGQLKLGGDVNISVGPKGRDGDVGIIASENSATPIYSYAIAKGLYIGITLKGEVITIRGECNEKFYQKKCKPKDIIDRVVEMPKNNDYLAITSILDTYTSLKTKGNDKKDDKENNNNNKNDEINDDKEQNPENKKEVNI